MTDREKIILSWAGGLATLAIGYLIWRHEEKIHVANNDAQVSANAQIAQQNTQQIEDLLNALPGSGQSGGVSSFGYASPSDFGQEGSTSSAASPVDTNLAAIIEAFIKPPAQNPTQTTVQNPAPQPTTNTPAPIVDPVGPSATPQPIITGLPNAPHTLPAQLLTVN